MVFEVIIAAYFVEAVRGTYYHLKEAKRYERALNRFYECRGKTWEEWAERVKEDKANNPKLYEKIPQTWMYRLYWKLNKG